MAMNGTQPYQDLHLVEQAKRMYDSLYAGDWEDVNKVLSPDVVVREPEGLPYGGTYRGHEGFTELANAVSEHWEDLRATDMTFTCSDSVVHMESILVGTSRATGKMLRVPLIESWTFRDGLIVSGAVYYFDTHLVRQICGIS